MKMTSAEANKMINQLREEYRLILEQEINVLTFIAATTEDIDEAKPPYDYIETTAKKAEIEQKIRKIKHALNLFNISTIVDGFNMTVDEVLVFLPQSTETLRRMKVMLSKPVKMRAENTGRTSLIEYEYLNYDPEQVREDYDTLTEKKNRLLTALDVLNNTVPFEVEF